MRITNPGYIAYMTQVVSEYNINKAKELRIKPKDTVKISEVAKVEYANLNLKQKKQEFAENEQNMHVEVFIKSGREWVRAGMRTTMGELLTEENLNKTLTDKTFKSLLVGRHSPIEEFEVWVCAIVPERVRTHVVRHKELGKYVATSRPDIKYNIPIIDGMRRLSLRFNAKRLIEICWQRRCFASWKDTRELFDDIAQIVEGLDPAFEGLLVPSCVWFGWCPETNNKCKYYQTNACKTERNKLLKIVENLYNK